MRLGAQRSLFWLPIHRDLGQFKLVQCSILVIPIAASAKASSERTFILMLGTSLFLRWRSRAWQAVHL
jgi:hypothetical protein